MATVRSADGVGHLLGELGRIDQLISAAVTRMRTTLPDTPGDFRGLYITDDEVDGILDGTYPVTPGFRPGTATQATKPQRAEPGMSRGEDSRLGTLAELFGLTDFDIDALLVCLAPELDLKYERLYAYLQDDVVKRRPRVDLVLNLLCDSPLRKLSARARFAAMAPLRYHQVLHCIDDREPGHGSPLLSRYLKVDERVVDFLLGSDEMDPRLVPYTRPETSRGVLDDLPLPADLRRSLRALVHRSAGAGRGAVVLLQGPDGVGRRTAASAMCAEADLDLLVLDCARLVNVAGPEFEDLVHRVVREAALRGSVLFCAHFEALLAAGCVPMRQALVRIVSGIPRLTFLSSNAAWQPTDTPLTVPLFRAEFPRPGSLERLRLWHQALRAAGGGEPDAGLDLPAVSSRFALTGGQIRDAVATAHDMAHFRDPENVQLTTSNLFAACRLHSTAVLSTLAVKIVPRRAWSDITLPVDALTQLRELCDQVKYRSTVYEQWGFGYRLSPRTGINALFAGPSGTGKTMAAEVVAGELGLDLYKIDLAAVVSKYVGETEKNLARVFDEAQTGNAILFFDEADALFGQRSEVRDAHDRYANVEVSFLLQQMEQHEGVVILATNLRKNMDDGFVRRMQTAIDFPMPSAEERARIWVHVWPAGAPLGADLDLDLMARRFELSGGGIRNIALGAAFLAAAEGAEVTMDHLLRATRREYKKMGRVMGADDFSGVIPQTVLGTYEVAAETGRRDGATLTVGGNGHGVRDGGARHD